ncbi:MAG: TauD/TfdA family dioxygenase [Pseudomonadota bacterium]|nr:TauD/TfdA family dioxygenase [Pseudomonadota bacterium]
MSLSVEPSAVGCGALIRGVDLSQPQSPAAIDVIRHAWLEHQVIGICDQDLDISDLERFAAALGPDGDDPFIASIAGHPRVVEVRREADETTAVFAEAWHSDWSFLQSPPAGTLLYGKVIPPVGGDTLFANQYAAYDALSETMKARIARLQGIHSARRSYSAAGVYGERDKGRSMAIRYSERAMGTQLHPIVRSHPETGRPALFVNLGYTIGIDGMSEADATRLLTELFAHQTRPEFLYRHRWSPGLLTLWDNRCLLHTASGGYQGYQRLLWRITIGERRAEAH